MYRDSYDRETEQFFRLHPYKIFMYLLLGSLCALFFGVSAAYLYQVVNNEIDTITPPTLFLLNSLILLGASWFIIQANKAYKNDNTKAYTGSLIVTLLLTIVFMIAQTAGWVYMFNNGMLARSNPSTGYLYVISSLHFLHVIGGIPFLALFIHAAHKRMKEPVSVLVYFSDPEKRLKLTLLTTYWHFLDALWIYLVAFFMLMKVVKMML